MGAIVGLWVQLWDFGCSCGSLGKFVVFWELWYFGYRSWGVYTGLWDSGSKCRILYRSCGTLCLVVGLRIGVFVGIRIKY